MENQENYQVKMFIGSYQRFAETFATFTKRKDQIEMANCTLRALLNAQDYLDQIEKGVIYNTLLLAKSLEKKYQDVGLVEIRDLKNYLSELSKLSIIKENFQKR